MKKQNVCLCVLIMLCASACSKNEAGSDECKPACVESNAISCDASGKEVSLNCTYGCTDGTCDPAPGEEKCQVGCNGGIATTCNADGSSTTQKCLFGCEGNGCANDPGETSNSGPCSGVSCKNNGRCDKGICISAQMSSVNDEDSCDKWFQGYCDGDTKVTCVAGKIQKSDCSPVKGCAMSKVKGYGDTYLIPTCRKDADLCASEKTAYCVVENNAGQSEAHAYSVACWDNTDDTKSGDKGESDYLVCEANGCNPQKTSCWNKCDGDTLQMYNGSNMDCKALNDICVTLEQNGFCAEGCWQKDEVTNGCFNDNERKRVCKADDDGRLYYVDEIFPCDHGCDSSTGKCKKLVQDEYTACDWNTFAQRCENDIRVACVQGIVHAEKCSTEDKVCTVMQNAATCVETCSSKEMKYCDDKNLVTKVCEKNEAGTLVPVSIKNEHCPYSCNPNKLECDCNLSGYWCEGNELTSCNINTSKVEHTSCGSNICYEFEDYSAKCYQQKYRTEEECREEKRNLKCNGDEHVTYSGCTIRRDNSEFSYLWWEEEHCEAGCSAKEDKCCDKNSEYLTEDGYCNPLCDDSGSYWDPKDKKCYCDKYHYEVGSNRCLCKPQFSVRNGSCNKMAKPGDIVSFGRYYEGTLVESNVFETWLESLEWKVLDIDKSKHRMLLLSRKVIDTKPYNVSSKENIKWENSTLRSWLNGYNQTKNSDKINYQTDNFINTAFNDEELSMILSVENDTGVSDKVFILSKAEVKAQEAIYGCLWDGVTDYAYYYDESPTDYVSYYYLRDTKYPYEYAYMTRCTDDKIDDSDINVYQGIRPAIWVKIDDVEEAD